MYPVSGAYLAAIAASNRISRITGTITLVDNTVIHFTDADILQGSLYYTEQSVSGEDLDIGSVFVAEMGMILTVPLEDPYALDGARVEPAYGILVGPDTWEDVPLGIYYVVEPKRAHRAVAIQAYDGMLRLDVDLDGVITSGTPEAMLVSLAARAGVVLAPLPAELPNKTITLTIPPDSEIATCRDLLMWVCQATGSFARMSRLGALEIVLHGSGSPVRIIPASSRYSSQVSDTLVHITQVSMTIGDATYTRGSSGMTLDLEDNPLLDTLDDTAINGLLDGILGAVGAVEYVPCDLELVGDPSLQPGDLVELTGTGALGGGDVATLITHSSWRYRGKHTIRGAGKSGLLRSAGPRDSQAVAAIRAAAKRLQLAIDTNRDDIQAAYDELTDAINYAATDITSTTTTAITETANSILSTVEQQYTAQAATAALEALIQSTIEQTSTDIEFAFSNATQYTVEVDEALQEYMNVVANYIRFSGEGIELGEEGSAFMTKLSNTRLSFIQNGVEIAYIAHNRMYITDGQFMGSISLGNATTGNYRWQLEANGSMSLAWEEWDDGG